MTEQEESKDVRVVEAVNGEDVPLVQIALLDVGLEVEVLDCNGKPRHVLVGSYFDCKQTCGHPACDVRGYVWVRVVWATGWQVIERADGYLVDEAVHVAVIAVSHKEVAAVGG